MDTSTPIIEILYGECLPRPGELEGRALRIRWTETQVETGEAGSTVMVGGSGARFSVQLSRSARHVRPGPMARLFGAEERVEHRLHVELRAAGSDRTKLMAVVSDTTVLDGLPELEVDGEDVQFQPLFDLLVTLVAQGASLAAYVLRDDEPQASSRITVDVEQLDTLRSGKRQLEDRVATLEEVLASARGELRAQQRATHEEASEAAALEQALQELRDAKAELEAQLGALRAQHQALQQSHTRTKHELDRAKTVLEVLDAKNTTKDHGAMKKTLFEHNVGITPEVALPKEKKNRGVVCPRCREADGRDVEMVGGIGVFADEGMNKLNTALCPVCGFLGIKKNG